MSYSQHKIRFQERREMARLFGLRLVFFTLLFLTSPIDLFVLSSKKILAENTSQAAQEDRLTFASATGQTQAAAIPGTAVMGEEQWVMLVYQKGKDSYDRGDYIGARAEWDKLNGIVDRYPAFKIVIDYLRGRQKNISTDVTEQVERQLAERRKQIEVNFQKGKEFFDQGKMPQALAAWDKLALYLPDDAPQRRLIRDMKIVYQKTKEDPPPKSTTPEVLSEESSAEMIEFFTEGVDHFKTQAQQARAATSDAENAQKNATESYARAKLLYYQGDYVGAMKEIEKLTSYFPKDSLERRSFESLLQNYRQALEEKTTSDRAFALKDLKVKLPEDFSRFSSEINERFSSEIKEAKTRRLAGQKSMEDKQSWASSDFRKGMELYREGHVDEAVNLWENAAPSFEDETVVRAVIALIRKNQLELKKIETDRAAALAENQKLIKDHLEKGRLLFKDGNFQEAKKEWLLAKPLIEDDKKFDDFISQVQQIFQDSLEANRKAQEMLQAPVPRVKTPESISGILQAAQEKLTLQTQQASIQEQKSQAFLKDREALLEKIFSDGKLLWDAGKMEESLQEWSKLLPLVENESELKQTLEGLRADYEASLNMAQKAQIAESKKDAKLNLPEDLSKALLECARQIRAQADAANAREKSAEQSQIDNQAFVTEHQDKAKSYFIQGDYSGALKEWEIVVPRTTDAEKLEPLMNAAKQSAQDLLLAQRSANEAERARDNKTRTPSDISRALADVSEKLKERTVAAQKLKSDSDLAFASRQTEIQATFDTGTKYYWEGKLGDAIRTWALAAPSLEDSEIKTSIESLIKLHENMAQVQKTAQEAELRKDEKSKTPEDLPKLLEDMKKIVQSQTQYAETQKKIADQTFVDRQSLINTTFQKGKNLYEQDRIPEALEEWSTITPYLEKGSQSKEFIDAVAKNYENLLVVKKAAEEAQIKKTVKFQAPEDMARVLEEAGNKLRAQVEDSKTRKESSENSRRERQLFIDGKFQRGQLLYQQGQVEEALTEWKAILPYIQDDSKVRQLILKAEENRRLLEEEPQAAPQRPLILPADLEKTLESVNKTLEKKTEAKSREKLEADVLDVIQNKKEKLRKGEPKKAAKVEPKVQLDEIEQMMLEYDIATPQELEKQHQELKAVQ